jgi:hypothetical protein
MCPEHKCSRTMILLSDVMRSDVISRDVAASNHN